MERKTVKVVAAVIYHENKVFVTQRGYGEFRGGWEFPGGKIEVNETPQEALIREIKEELDIDIDVHELLDIVEYDYPTFHLAMQIFWCSAKNIDFVLKEHEAASWLAKDELGKVDWLPADEAFIVKLQQYKDW